MSPTEGFVSGWVPSYGDDDDVEISNFAYPINDFHPPSPTLSRTSSNDSHLLSLAIDQLPPSPGSSVDHTDGSHTDPSSIPLLSSSDRRAIRNRMRDPDWVPRPRNAFIIFRCEYSRKHARDPSDPSDRSGRSDKTLSKRAGEEWRRLSATEREQYKVLAEQEKATHALQNPDYRFKPVRRPPPGVAPSAARGRLVTCRRTDRSAQVASLIMRSERGASSFARDDDYEDKPPPQPPAAQASSSAVVTGRRRAASMPQPVAPLKAVVPAKPRTPVPISCMSSPGPTPLDFDMFSEMDDSPSPLYTPIIPTSPVLHGPPSGFQMVPLPEHPASSSSQAFECGMGMGVGGTQNSSAPIGDTSGAYAYTDSSYDQHQQFTFTNADVYPTSLETTTPYTGWACGAPTESYLALAGAATTLPKSPDTGAVGSLGPTPLPIPFALQHSMSAPHEIPAALWGAGYAEPANGAAMFGGAQSLSAVFSEEALPAGYDVAAAQVGLNEFINAL